MYAHSGELLVGAIGAEQEGVRFERPRRAVAEVAAARHVVEAGHVARVVLRVRVCVRVLLAAHRIARLAGAARVRLQSRGFSAVVFFQRDQNVRC